MMPVTTPAPSGLTGSLPYLAREVYNALPRTACFEAGSISPSASRGRGRCAILGREAGREAHVPVVLVARFDGDVQKLTAAYDRAHELIMSRGGAVPSGELRHHCATDAGSLYIIGVWESADHLRRRWSSEGFRETLVSSGFPPEPSEMTILDLHAIEPPLQ